MSSIKHYVKLLGKLSKTIDNLTDTGRYLSRKEAVLMGKADKKGDSKPMRPALTPEARENQMISLAVDLAERQLREGTASSQVIAHYLKLGTTKAVLEKEKLERENELLRAKTESLQSAQRIEELYESAIKAMQRYGGQGGSDDDY